MSDQTKQEMAGMLYFELLNRTVKSTPCFTELGIYKKTSSLRTIKNTFWAFLIPISSI